MTMIFMQIVIRVSNKGDFRGHDHSTVTSDRVDVYALAVEVGLTFPDAEKIAKWCEKAMAGDIWGPKLLITRGQELKEITVKCHLPKSRAEETKGAPKKKRGRPKVRRG